MKAEELRGKITKELNALYSQDKNIAQTLGAIMNILLCDGIDPVPLPKEKCGTCCKLQFGECDCSCHQSDEERCCECPTELILPAYTTPEIIVKAKKVAGWDVCPCKCHKEEGRLQKYGKKLLESIREYYTIEELEEITGFKPKELEKCEHEFCPVCNKCLSQLKKDVDEEKEFRKELLDYLFSDYKEDHSPLTPYGHKQKLESLRSKYL